MKSTPATPLNSTVLLIGVDFQLAFAPTQFNADRSVWRLVIYLNIIGFVLVAHSDLLTNARC